MAILAVDIGGSAVKYGVWDQEEIKDQGEFPTPATRQTFFDELLKVKKEFEQKYDLEGLALSAPGNMDEEAGTIKGVSYVPFLHLLPIKDSLKEAIGLKVTMENDANCGALAEMTYGIGKGYQQPIFLIIGSGVGLSIIKDGKISSDLGLKLDEIDKKIAEENARLKSPLASPVSMAKRVSLRKLKLPSEIDGKKAFELAEKGDEDAVKEVTAMCDSIADIALKLQNAYHPEFIGIGGGASNNESYIEGIKKSVQKLVEEENSLITWLKGVFGKDEETEIPEIKPCHFKNDANLIGAVIHYQEVYKS